MGGGEAAADNPALPEAQAAEAAGAGAGVGGETALAQEAARSRLSSLSAAAAIRATTFRCWRQY